VTIDSPSTRQSRYLQYKLSWPLKGTRGGWDPLLRHLSSTVPLWNSAFSCALKFRVIDDLTELGVAEDLGQGVDPAFREEGHGVAGACAGLVPNQCRPNFSQMAHSSGCVPSRDVISRKAPSKNVDINDLL